jgi:hypothetical protein
MFQMQLVAREKYTKDHIKACNFHLIYFFYQLVHALLIHGKIILPGVASLFLFILFYLRFVEPCYQ